MVEPTIKDAIISLLRKRNDWTMIKEIIEELMLDVDRMHLSGYLDALVDAGILQFKQVFSAKQYQAEIIVNLIDSSASCKTCEQATIFTRIC